MTSQLRRLLALSFIVFVVTATSTFAQRNRPHDEANPRGYAPNRISDGERSSKPSPQTPAHDEANPRGYAPNRISDGERDSQRSAPTPAHDEANPRGYAPNRISDGEGGERQSTISPPHDESNPRAYGGQNSSPILDQGRSVRGTYGNRDSIFLYSNSWNPDGHKYVAINSLGRPNLSVPHQVTNIKRDLNRALPWFDAIGRNGQSVTLGNVFNLRMNVAGRMIDNPVRVIAVDDDSFTLEALPGHALRGTVTFGIFKDNSGESWLYHIGKGVKGEPEDWQDFNYMVAKQMWPDMAPKVRELNSGSSASTPSRSPAQQAPRQARGVRGTTTDGRRYRF